MPSWTSRCGRCGQDWWSPGPHGTTITCIHPEGCKVTDMNDEEAARVRARYAFGKIHNPEHDATSYRDRAVAQPEDPRGSVRCSRCGEYWFQSPHCGHLVQYRTRTMTDVEAARVQARFKQGDPRQIKRPTLIRKPGRRSGKAKENPPCPPQS